MLTRPSRIRLALRPIRHAWQRLTRGWDDREVWSLDWSLCRRLGAQLEHLADTTHGYPGTPEYPTPESWEADLRKHGRALKEYAKDFDELPERYAAAQESLLWVATHLGQLWD